MQMKNGITLGVNLLATFLLLGASQPTLGSSNAIFNGDFETGDFAGWSVVGNVLVFGFFADSCCEPSSGLFAVGFNGGDISPNGQLSQTFATVIGTKYFLDFDFGKGGIGFGLASLGISVSGVNTVLDEMVSDSTGGAPGPYSRLSFSFVADSTSSTLSFSDTSTGTLRFDALIDHVVLCEATNDSDHDCVDDSDDNCIYVANLSQRDTDDDGIGNACDADLNNDCAVNFIDLGIMKSVFFTGDVDADLDGDGNVDFADLGTMKEGFFLPPGPSGVPNSCDGS